MLTLHSRYVRFARALASNRLKQGVTAYEGATSAGDMAIGSPCASRFSGSFLKLSVRRYRNPLIGATVANSSHKDES